MKLLLRYCRIVALTCAPSTGQVAIPPPAVASGRGLLHLFLLGYFAVMPCYDLAHVGHAPVGHFDCIPVDDFRLYISVPIQKYNLAKRFKKPSSICMILVFNQIIIGANIRINQNLA